MDQNKKPLPNLNRDEEVNRFIDECNLSKYDLSSFKPLSSYAFAKTMDATPPEINSQLQPLPPSL